MISRRRRHWGGITLSVFAVALVLGGPSAGAAASASAPNETTQAYKAGVEAYVHGYPPLLNQLSQRMFLVNSLVGIAGTNKPSNRLTVLPNVDTAYSVARLDLRSGPVVVHVPAMPGRYYVLQLMDAYTNVFGYIGTRATGSRAGDYAIAGPGYRGSVPGMKTIHSPTPDAVLVGRTLIKRGDTTARLKTVLASYAMGRLSTLNSGGQLSSSLVLDTAPKSRPPVVPTGLPFLNSLDQLLTQDPPSAAEARALAPLKRFGIGPGRHISSTQLSAPVQSALLRGVAVGPARVSALVRQTQHASIRHHRGWVLTGPKTGDFGPDWSLRAVIAKTELWANTPSEAVYPVGPADSAGRPLTGGHRYALTFKGRPPGRAFWSVTMYDSGLHLYANPLSRYELGDRSPGLVPGRGGALTLYIQHRQPNGHRSAWLPAPAGRFTVVLRLYNPSPAAVAGRWTPPGIKCLDCRGRTVHDAPLARLPGSSATSESQAEKVGADAYRYGIALMEFLRLQREQTSVTVPNPYAFAPLNQLGSQRQLTTAAHQPNVGPNDDTLYTLAHLDLSRGAEVLHVPRISGHRYYVFQFVDPYTNDFAYIGTRTTGDRGGNYVVTGPRFHGHVPRGLQRISSPYNLVWVVGRTLVRGESDLPAVHRIEAEYRLVPLTDYERVGLTWRPHRPKRIVTKATPATVPTGVRFFDALGTALAQNPPPKRDAAILTEMATEGLGPGRQPSKEHLGAAVLAGLAQAADDGPATVTTITDDNAVHSAASHNGWYVPAKDIGAFGVDYTLRASIAVNGIGANRPAEAVYAVGIESSDHQLLAPGNRYVIHFDARQLPPARYFWSVTMYDGASFLIPNQINRYSLGNHSPGLKYNRDGSLDLYLQPSPPPGHRSNWLPSPTSGSFHVTLRMYGPRSSVLNGTYRYPSITLAGPSS